MSPPTDRPIHTSTVRVRYAETDQMGVAYYANYLVWFEVARTDFLRERGLRYRDLESRGLRLPVGEVGIRMLRPARYDDVLQVHCWLEELRTRSLRLGYEIARPEPGAGVTVIATGTTTLVATGADLRPHRFPPDVRERLASLGAATPEEPRS
jgi:acyl-CoA thioester hydrolase